ncbi:MAG: saccharopine dehydrogenase NADP-binding domain-containing protein [Chloroflexota bacterium]|nr:saccharopine dehydrogenase NADP-binding domain-containing protein [Chloroflexota bacterium]
MSKVTVLGGCGGVGSVAARTLARSGVFSEVAVADIDLRRIEQTIARMKANNVLPVEFDADSPESIKQAIDGSSVVLNCVGPYYKYGPIILKAVIESKIDYVDVCDDFDATERLLAMDEQAREAGITALIGMGSSPGIANVLVRLCADVFFDRLESVDIYHAHGGEEVEGPAVVKHRIHSMSIDIPMFLDGRFTTVRLFDESGRALEEETDFRDVGTYSVYAYPHPETITLPKYLKGVTRVTNLGLVLPPAYAEIIKGVVRLGIISEEPIQVQGHSIVPLEFAVAYILSQKDRLTREAGLTGPMGCLKIVVKGTKNGEPGTYVFSMSSRSEGMGEGTGVPAALGVVLMALGKIQEKGVCPPEACVDPLDVLQLAKASVRTSAGSRGFPIVIEHIDAKGNKEEIDPWQVLEG